MKSKTTVMFFTPHADDIEFGTPFMYLEALRLGNRRDFTIVQEALAQYRSQFSPFEIKVAIIF